MYPKKVTIDNPKLKKLILEKEELVLKGRAISEEIEKIEDQLESIDAEIQTLEKDVDISDLNEKAEKITEEFNLVVGKMDSIKTKIYERMKEVVDSKVTDLYEKMKVKKEELETERNKIALQAQKRRDKIIPLARKAMEGYLESPYEDYNSIVIDNDQIVGSIFNHKEEWETKFLSKKQ